MKRHHLIIKKKEWLVCISIFFAAIVHGQYNTNLGYKAGDAVSTGHKNVMVGERAGALNNGTGNIFIGSYAGKNETGSNTLIISNDTLKNTIYGDLSKRRVAIATNLFPTDTLYRLAVEGKVIAREYKATQATWPDYVFEDEYKLMSLDSLQMFLTTNKHLPNVPSALEVEKDGIELAKMNAILLEKIEEVTLYMLKLQGQVNNQQEEIERLKTNSVSNKK